MRLVVNPASPVYNASAMWSSIVNPAPLRMGVFAVALLLHIPLGGVEIVRLLLLSPILCLAGGALGICFISFVRDPKVAGMGSLLRVFPQLFLSGVFIPIRHTSGLLALLTSMMPMTYSVDLARAVFYWGSSAHSRTGLYSPLLDLVVTAAFVAVFSIIGIVLFTHAEQYR